MFFKAIASPSVLTVMAKLMATGLTSVDEIDRETATAGGDAEEAATRAVATLMALTS